jgi:hypothetical protein
VKVEDPVCDGVPLMVAPERFNPFGRLPCVMDQVYAPSPPDAVKVWEYAPPCVACGIGDAVVTVNRGLIWSVKSFSPEAD